MYIMYVTLTMIVRKEQKNELRVPQVHVHVHVHIIYMYTDECKKPFYIYTCIAKVVMKNESLVRRGVMKLTSCSCKSSDEVEVIIGI